MRIVSGLVTVVILALLGQAMLNAHWLIPIVPVAAVWLGYRLGTPYEKREFRVAIPRLLRRFRLRAPAPRLRSPPANLSPRSGVEWLCRDD